MGSKLIVLILLTLSSKVFAAACCGGGAGQANILTEDYQARFSIAGMNSAVTHSADNQGDISKRLNGDKEVVETISLSGSYMISDYWQVGAVLPYTVTSREKGLLSERSKSTGDFKFNVGFEFMPEFSFSLWKPRGFLFIEQTVPTTRSIHNSRRKLQTDSISKGFYTTSVGFLFKKKWSFMDLTFTSEYHRGLSRSFRGGSVKINPKGGYSSSVAVGNASLVNNVRFGGSIMYAKEDGYEYEELLDNGQSKYHWELGAVVSYGMGGYAVDLVYTDQSYLGVSKNTNLSKSLGISFVKLLEL
jgi:hypothetical protein